jgi:hypothetical protein
MSNVAESWSNRDIQNDPAGYREAQRREREQAEVERKEAAEESDFQSFAKMYEERGGDPSKAREMYRKYRDDMAFEETKKLDQQARNRMRTERNRIV